MDKEEILNCLTLGSKDEYRPNSLSKYGMGLKSAGFSLGNRISVCSKKNGSLSKYVLDKNKLKETGKWTVLSEDVGEADASDLASFDSGTIIEISDCKTYETPSAETVSRKLNNKAGAVYYHLIKNEKIKIYFRFNKEERMLIDPLDILFREESQDEFSAETYDCKTPVKVYEEDISFSANSNLAKMEIVIFPQARMSTYRFFSDEDRKNIQRYQVNKENKGFFIFRNGRLIRWGDSISGMVARDLLGFRAAVYLDSSHDELFNIDVSKQRITIPEEVVEILTRLSRNPIKYSEDAFACCSKLWDSLQGAEGEDFNIQNQDMYEEDPDLESGLVDIAEMSKRKSLIEEETIKEQKEIEQEKGSAETVEYIFERVRYGDRVPAKYVWDYGQHTKYGIFATLNKNHSFYIDIISRLDKSNSVKQAIEGLFWACAVSEGLTKQNLTDVDASNIEKVIDKFKKLFSTNLETWCSKNRDLIE